MVPRRQVLGLSMTMLAIVGLGGSGSRTALLALAVSVGLASTVVVGRKWSAHKPGPIVPSLVVGGAGAGLATLVVCVARFWEEPTFVQRRIIWDLLFDHIKDRPIRGHGFQAFWSVPELIGQHELLGRGSAHNSAVEVLLQTGVIGLVFWLTVVLTALGVTMVSAWRSPSMVSWLWFALVVFLIVENLTESYVNWFSYNWLLLIVAALGPLRSRPARVELRTSQPNAEANA
jgi:O-antigen ligase